MRFELTVTFAIAVSAQKTDLVGETCGHESSRPKCVSSIKIRHGKKF